MQASSVFCQLLSHFISEETTFFDIFKLDVKQEKNNKSNGSCSTYSNKTHFLQKEYQHINKTSENNIYSNVSSDNFQNEEENSFERLQGYNKSALQQNFEDAQEIRSMKG